MREQTARLALIWLRLTLALAAALAVVMTVYGLHSVEFTVSLVLAVLVDLVAVRALCREWAWQARGCWWRFW